MQLCLEDPVGNYTPLKLTDVPVQSNSSNSSKKMTSRSQSTGGGWSSSSDDEDNVLEEFSQHVSDSIDNGDNVVNDWCNREDINNLELLSTLQEVISVIEQQGDAQTAIFTIINILKTNGEEEKLFRALLLLKHLLHRGLMSVTKIDGLYSKVADRLENSSSSLIVNKARKLSLTLSALK